MQTRACDHSCRLQLAHKYDSDCERYTTADVPTYLASFFESWYAPRVCCLLLNYSPFPSPAPDSGIGRTPLVIDQNQGALFDRHSFLSSAIFPDCACSNSCALIRRLRCRIVRNL